MASTPTISDGARYDEYMPAGFDAQKMEYDARKNSTGCNYGTVEHFVRYGSDDIHMFVHYNKPCRSYVYKVDGVPTPRDHFDNMLVNARAEQVRA